MNAVNEVGVMGKGIALQFRDAFPGSARAYEQACKRKEVQVGRVLLTETGNLSGPRWVIHFPTKKHWRKPSQLQWVRDGLKDLARVLLEREIRSAAVPALGCGNGGLDWRQVKGEIELVLGALPDVEVLVYAPSVAGYEAV
ncbi:MAG: macro domain-containing protein [Planctomycetota bacterium]